MIYSTLIAQIRNQVGDTRRRVHVDWIGDGSTTVFQMPDDTYPVLDQIGTYLIKLAGVTKVETTDYTLDKETGTLTMVAAPGSSVALTIDGSAVYITDVGYLDIIANTIRSLGRDFWKEFTDSTSFTATANMQNFSLVAGQPNCMAVYEFARRVSVVNDWYPAENTCNWRYDDDNNAIYISTRDAFTTTGELIKIRGLKFYNIPTAVTDTIDVQDRYLPLLEYGIIFRYWKYRYKSVVELISKMTQENTRTPLQELIMLSDRAERDFDALRARLKPMKPARIVPVYIEGVGRA